MTQAIPIYRGQDFYVPAYEVLLGDRPLRADAVHDITKVTYKDGLGEVDSFEITVNNWDAGRRDFKYSDTDLFLPGKAVQLSLGYRSPDQLRLMIKGEITSLRPSFPAGGQPTLTVGGLNVLHRFRGEQFSMRYLKKTDSGIARQIGDRLKVEMEIDERAAATEPVYDYVLQRNQYALLFLYHRAQRAGYDLVVKEIAANGRYQGSKLFFGPSQGIRRVTYELTWGKSLVEFQPTLNTTNQVGEVIVRGWDALHKKKIVGRAVRSQLSTRGVGAAGGQAAIEKSFEDRKEVVVDKPVASKKEADKLALETLERIAKGMVQATGSTVGLPDLRSGGVIQVAGLGDRFSGRYFLTSTTHTISDAGYTTQFGCRLEENGQ
jgi:uncharacterized protein